MDTSDLDYPANTSTPGAIGVGQKDYGVVSTVGDADWFKVSLTAGQQYRFTIEAGTINGLFDPQLGFYNGAGNLIQQATVGQGFQTKYIVYTPTAGGDFFLAASGGTLVGSYSITVANETTKGIIGTAGDDSLIGTSGNDTVNGGTGTDTWSCGGNRNNFTLTNNKNGTYTLVDKTGANGTDTLTGVEKLWFNDMTVNLAVQSQSTTVSSATLTSLVELYVAYFNRVPDSNGLSYWIDQFKAGQSIEKIGNSFYESAILYTAQTGYSSSMTNSDFVSVIYKNVLSRTGATAPPAADVNYWANNLASGADTRGSLIKTMLASAHSFKGDATWGYVANLLDNKVSVSKTFAIDYGLTYNSPTDSITNGMAIAAAVTADSTAAAIKLIGVTDAMLTV